MIRKGRVKRREPRIRLVANEKIRATDVRAIAEDGAMIGTITLSEAIQRAREENKDVVLVNELATPPIVKLIELSKFKFQQQQKAAAGRKRAKTQELKEVRFTPFMSDGDFEARLKKVSTFLKRGDKVRLSLQYKGRQITKQEFGQQVFARVIERTSEYSTVELEPKMLGKKLIAQLLPVKKIKQNDKK